VSRHLSETPVGWFIISMKIKTNAELTSTVILQVHWIAFLSFSAQRMSRMEKDWNLKNEIGCFQVWTRYVSEITKNFSVQNLFDLLFIVYMECCRFWIMYQVPLFNQLWSKSSKTTLNTSLSITFLDYPSLVRVPLDGEDGKEMH